MDYWTLLWSIDVDAVDYSIKITEFTYLFRTFGCGEYFFTLDVLRRVIRVTIFLIKYHLLGDDDLFF